MVQNCTYVPPVNLTEAEVNWSSLETDSCTIDASAGGAVSYRLQIKFIDPSLGGNFNSISFNVQNPEMNGSLLEEGPHLSHGESSDKISNSLQGGTYSAGYLGEGVLEIYFNDVNGSIGELNGSGYVKINEQVNVTLPGINEYYSPRTIPFEC